jgi:hypothetical protein
VTGSEGAQRLTAQKYRAIMPISLIAMRLLFTPGSPGRERILGVAGGQDRAECSGEGLRWGRRAMAGGHRVGSGTRGPPFVNGSVNWPLRDNHYQFVSQFQFRRMTMKLTIAIGLMLMTGACVADMGADGSGTRVAVTASELAGRGFHIHKTQSTNCLVARAGSGERPVQQTACGDFTDQDWDFPDAGDFFQIRNLDRNQCIVTRGSNIESNAVTTTCDTQFADQLWLAFLDMSTGAFEFQNANSKECLAARGNLQAIQTTCANFSDQRWLLE